jgi:hypothetical protein
MLHPGPAPRPSLLPHYCAAAGPLEIWSFLCGVTESAYGFRDWAKRPGTARAVVPAAAAAAHMPSLARVDAGIAATAAAQRAAPDPTSDAAQGQRQPRRQGQGQADARRALKEARREARKEPGAAAGKATRPGGGADTTHWSLATPEAEDEADALAARAPPCKRQATGNGPGA